MDRPSWAPDDIDTDRPSGARVYDYFLGGAHNFAADRALADAIAAMTPNIGDTMRANRAFLRRAVRYLVGEGITQFLDIGSGIPTVGNVHEVAQQADPSARVVYVDVDPVAVAHSRAILDGRAGTAVVAADARDVDRIHDDPETRRLLDPALPTAVLMLGVLHFLPDDDDPPGLVARLMARTAPGSAVALVNVTHEDQPPEVIEAQKLSGRTSTPIHLRSRAELTAQFAGLPLVEPGLVHLPLWRPDSPDDVDGAPERFGALAGIARKP
jgi:O-methyltransferase involved in polyketide biosynthesis